MNPPADSTRKTRIVVCGQNWLAQQSLEFLLKRPDTELCAVATTPKSWQADLVAWATQRGLKVFTGNINDHVDEIAALAPDLLISIQYHWLLRPKILSVPRLGCINLHLGLLPRYAGCSPIAWAILNGETEAGATLHFMTERFDDGDVIAQAKVPVTTETTARELFDAVCQAGAKLFAATYPSLRKGTIHAVPQDLSKQLYYRADSINFKRDSVIDWEKPGREVQRRICAFTFEPFQLPRTTLVLSNGQHLPVTVSATRLSTTNSDGAHPPGQIMAVTASGAIVVATGSDDSVEVGGLNKQPAREFIQSLGVLPSELRLQAS